MSHPAGAPAWQRQAARLPVPNIAGFPPGFFRRLAPRGKKGRNLSPEGLFGRRPGGPLYDGDSARGRRPIKCVFSRCPAAVRNEGFLQLYIFRTYAKIKAESTKKAVSEMKVAIASDHGGIHIREEIKKLLEELNIEYEDFGCDCETSVDYPDYAFPVAEKVAKGEFDRGILICGTGIGMSIAANKVKGIRCALCHDVFSAKATREHNDSNILAMGERVIGPGLAREIAKVWLTTPFTGGRHAKRIDKIAKYEEANL